jgi:tryptophan synthase alpha chain
VNRIKRLVREITDERRGKKLLSAYVMPGFPRAESTLGILKAVEEAGVDFVELGVPFSDPLADGPVIQDAAQIAIRNGMSPGKILEIVKTFRKESELPIVLMGYMNSLLNGIGREFPKTLVLSGVDGVIIPDLSLEESFLIRDEIESAALSLTLLVAPTSTEERIRRISEASSDFMYCVSVTGVTGVRRNLVSDDVIEFLSRVQKFSVKPFVVGFGISNPETARNISAYSHGVVVGSALLQKISASPDSDYAAYDFMKSLRMSIDSGN